MIARQDIQHYAQLLAERFTPEKIILFGSYANGHPTEDSDVDLLVLMEHEGRAWEKATEMRMNFRPPFALDLLIRRSSEVKRQIEDNDAFWLGVLETGVVLHERLDS